MAFKTFELMKKKIFENKSLAPESQYLLFALSILTDDYGRFKCTLSELTSLIDLGPNTVSVLLDDLERLGLLSMFSNGGCSNV